MDFKKTIMETENVTKADSFKSFLHQIYSNTQLIFFCDSAASLFFETNINWWFLGVTEKLELHISFKNVRERSAATNYLLLVFSLWLVKYLKNF